VTITRTKSEQDIAEANVSWR